MFIGAGLEANGITLGALVAGVDVGKQVIHGVTDVGITVDIGDCGGEINVFCHGYIIA